MDDEWHTQAAQSAAHRRATAVAETEIDNGCRESGMFGGEQRRFEVAGRDHLGPCGTQSVVDIEGNESFIFNEENESAGKTAIWHRTSLEGNVLAA
jgi:hypothetical protein